MNENMKIAKELLKIAKELCAGNAFDNAKYFQKAISNPTPQNVSNFTKSLGNSPASKNVSKNVSKPIKDNGKKATKHNDDSMDAVAASLLEIAKQMLDKDDEEENQ